MKTTHANATTPGRWNSYPAARVLVVGNVVLDLVVGTVRELPRPGRMARVSTSRLCTGGCGGNTAEVLARMGVNVGLVGTIGGDTLGELLAGRLADARVDTDGLIRCEGVNTSITVVLVWEGGERSFLHSGSNSNVLDGGHLETLDTAGVEHLHVGGAMILGGVEAGEWAGLLKRFRRDGATTSLDPAWDARGRWLEALEPALPYLDYIFPNRLEVEKLTGEADPVRAAESLIGMGVRKVVVKLEGDGCLLVNEKGVLSQPAFEVEEVVDTTGAGDAFNAGFIAALMAGEDEKGALKWGSAAGALAVTDYGATTAVSSKRRVLRFLSRG